MDTIKKLNLPLTEAQISDLKAGDKVELTGIIYTGRDAAHKRLVDLIKTGKPLPFDLNNATIYYVGPTPHKPGRAIGSCGPTSSYRMDPFMEPMMEKGLKIMIGKGPRSEEYRQLLVKYHAVYMSAIGGTAALISETVKKCDLIAYEDLGAEAIFRLEVVDFFAIVTYDSKGNDLFNEGIKKYQKPQI